ncbi:MAG: hypothetical protein SPL73_03930 [Cyanobacteriota bacterium]|nr:hypothetical protein [Cyanobacteriota bacterium]MDY6358497.1 hypothetical protein [Cyanobacteriota bacterium]MDY6364019.1 hypothetical protein [Cyanobacteriota bacterium]
MPVAAANIGNTKIGTCPHGMPMGACPICNGMAGGNSTTKRDTPRDVGEMTYNECAAIGALLKAQKAAQKRAQANQQTFIQSALQFQKNMESLHNKILDLAASISKNAPAIVAAPINFILNNVIGKLISALANTPNVMANFAQKFVDIADKLAAVYGEFKAAISKALSNLAGSIKKKLKSIFFIFGAEETDDEDKKVDEAKKAFNLKTFIHNLARKFKHEEERIADEY